MARGIGDLAGGRETAFAVEWCGELFRSVFQGVAPNPGRAEGEPLSNSRKAGRDCCSTVQGASVARGRPRRWFRMRERL